MNKTEKAIDVICNVIGVAFIGLGFICGLFILPGLLCGIIPGIVMLVIMIVFIFIGVPFCMIAPGYKDRKLAADAKRRIMEVDEEAKVMAKMAELRGEI